MIEIDETLYSDEEARMIIRAARSLANVLLARTAGYLNIMTAMPEIGAALDNLIGALDAADIAYLRALRSNDNQAAPYTVPMAVISRDDLDAVISHAPSAAGMLVVFRRRMEAERLFPGARMLAITSIATAPTRG